MAKNDTGQCEACGEAFTYQLIHNGFNESAFAYCNRCGCTALLDGYYEAIPAGAKLAVHGPVNPEAEVLLAQCSCGGSFRANASPRCVRCTAELSAESATQYLEANAPGTVKGWRWQRSWQGLYCIIIADRVVRNNWSGGLDLVREVYVRLLDEGTDVWRPVAATALADGTYILSDASPMPADENWEFPPGSRVVAEEKTFEGKTRPELVAVGLDRRSRRS
jgi:hypothetical protein